MGKDGSGGVGGSWDYYSEESLRREGGKSKKQPAKKPKKKKTKKINYETEKGGLA